MGGGFSGIEAGLSLERASFDTTDIWRGGTSQAGDGFLFREAVTSLFHVTMSFVLLFCCSGLH